MLRVALTGGLGSGKSTAAAIFQELGCFVSQSDEIARGMMQPGEAVYQSIVQHFGPGVLQGDGSLDRAALATLAFAQGQAEDLNRIIHPPVIAAQTAWLQAVGREHPGAVAIVESALIFESRHAGASQEAGGSALSPEVTPPQTAPWRARFDSIVLVTAPEELRLHRYIARHGASTHEEQTIAEKDARARMRAQMPEAEKATLSDWVIHNDGSLLHLRQRVSEVCRKLQALAAGDIH